MSILALRFFRFAELVSSNFWDLFPIREDGVPVSASVPAVTGWARQGKEKEVCLSLTATFYT